MMQEMTTLATVNVDKRWLKLIYVQTVWYKEKERPLLCTTLKLENFQHMLRNIRFTYIPQGGLVCEECPLSLNAFLSTRTPKGLKNIRYFCSIWGHFSRGSFFQKRPNQRSDHLVIPNKSDGELHEIMIKLRGQLAHTGRGIEPTVYIVTGVGCWKRQPDPLYDTILSTLMLSLTQGYHITRFYLFFFPLFKSALLRCFIYLTKVAIWEVEKNHQKGLAQYSKLLSYRMTICMQ